MEGNLFMEVNRETAMRLWNKNYGKRIRMKDFAGREMLKAAYDDRNSEFGWNLDHIYPVSKGGKTADYNLICCNIKTNDEKADTFPVFNANGKKFQIVRHENHHEIENCNFDEDSNDTTNEINLFDSAEGVEAFWKCSKEINDTKYIDCITVSLQDSDERIVEFICKHVFSDASSFIKQIASNCLSIKLVYFDKKLIQDFKNELDNCVLLNTYMLYYFLPKGLLRSYEIIFEGTVYNDLSELYSSFDEITMGLSSADINYASKRYDNCIYIDEFIADNLKIDISKVHSKYIRGYKKGYMHDFVFTKLSKNLEKEVNRK